MQVRKKWSSQALWSGFAWELLPQTCFGSGCSIGKRSNDGMFKSARFSSYESRIDKSNHLCLLTYKHKSEAQIPGKGALAGRPSLF